MTNKVNSESLGTKEVQSWEEGVKFILDAVVSSLAEEVTHKGPPMGVCVFVIHNSGDVTVVNGGPRETAEQHTLAALACEEVQRQLTQMAQDALTQNQTQEIQHILRNILGR